MIKASLILVAGLLLAVNVCHSMPMGTAGIEQAMAEQMDADYETTHSSLTFDEGDFTLGMPAYQISSTANLPTSARTLTIPALSRGFSSFKNWGGTGRNPPVLRSLKNEGLDLFLVDHSGNLQYRGGHYGRLYDWTALGGDVTGAPAVAVNKEGSIDVVVRHSDSMLYYNRFYSGKWSGWVPLHFKSPYDASTATWYTRGMFVFAVGTDGKMYKIERRHGGWWHQGSGRAEPKAEYWNLIPDGPTFVSHPVGAYVTETNSIDLAVMGLTSSGVLHATRFHISGAGDTLQNWVGFWEDLNQKGSMPPVSAHRATGFDVAIRTLEGKIAVTSWDKKFGWALWKEIDFNTPYAPTLSGCTKGSLYVIATDGNGQLQYCSRSSPTGPFGDFSKISGGPFLSAPASVIREGHILDVYAIDSNHEALHTQMDVPC